MRIHRVALRNYRGVERCELHFAEHGITVVEGPNEVGKTSVAEAIRLIIDHPDDSMRREVRVVQPVHRDVGAEVEVDLTIGAHRLTYAKRWHRDRSTQLKVLTPVAEVLSGRAAHDRVRELLRATVDLDLWRALSTPQAEGLEQRALRDHPSLTAALDAAGEVTVDHADRGHLVADAAAEAARWFTPSGRAKASLFEVRRAAADAREHEASTRAALERLEADVEWAGDLRRSAVDLEAKLATAADAARRAGAHLVDLEARRAAVDRLGLQAELAATGAGAAASAASARAVAAAAVTSAEAEAAEVEASLTASRSTVAAAKTTLAQAEAAVDVANEALAAAATQAAAAATAEIDLRGAELLHDAEERLAGARRRRAALDASLVVLAANRSDPAALDALQAAHDEVVLAQAGLAAGQARASLEAVEDVTIVVDGRTRSLRAGDREELAVWRTATVESPTLRVVLRAGADAAAAHQALESATAVLVERCRALGVADLAEGRALEQRRHAEAARVASDRAALHDLLGRADLDELEALVGRARAERPSTDRPGPRPTASDLAAGRDLRDDTEQAHRRAQREADHAGTARDGAAERAAAARAEVADREHHAARCATRSSDLAEALDEARAVAPDAELADDVAATARRADAAGLAWQRLAAEGADVDPDVIRRAAERRAAERDGLDTALRRNREDRAAIDARLEIQGEAGLHDRLGAAQRAVAGTEAVLVGVEGRAEAARLLHATLTRHRDEAARTYAAPLRAAIESLGRLVWGDGVAVHLDEELRVTARVLDGVPVPWADLSVGAREQLGVLTRLAVARLVCDGGGVPVVFDDVLGFTSPDRLGRMADAFTAAAPHCQIIVFTCDPGRYHRLDRAATHDLSSPRLLPADRAG